MSQHKTSTSRSITTTTTLLIPRPLVVPTEVNQTQIVPSEVLSPGLTYVRIKYHHNFDRGDIILLLFLHLKHPRDLSSSDFMKKEQIEHFDIFYYFNTCSFTELNHSDHTGLTLYEALHTLFKFLTLDTPQQDR